MSTNYAACWQYVPRPFLQKSGFKEEDDTHLIDDLPHTLGSNIDSKPREIMHSIVGRLSIVTWTFWTAVFVFDLAHVLGPKNHFQYLYSFLHADTHPRGVYDPGIALMIPDQVFWWIMFGWFYLCSTLATVLIFGGLINVFVTFKNIYYDLGVFLPVINFAMGCAELAVARISQSSDPVVSKTYWLWAIISSAVVLFVGAWLTIFCRQRRVRMNFLAWNAGPGIANQAMVLGYYMFAITVCGYKSQKGHLLSSAAAWTAWFFLGFTVVYYLIDLSAPLWYHYFTRDAFLVKDQGYNKFPRIQAMIAWIPGMYTVMDGALYFIGIVVSKIRDPSVWSPAPTTTANAVFACACIGTGVLLFFSVIEIAHLVVHAINNIPNDVVYAKLNNEDEVESAVKDFKMGKQTEIPPMQFNWQFT